MQLRERKEKKRKKKSLIQLPGSLFYKIMDKLAQIL